MNKIDVKIKCLAVLLCTASMFQTLLAQVSPNIQINFSKEILDYGPVFSKKINELLSANGGTLSVGSGTYPILTPIQIKYKGQEVILNIVGKKGTKGKLPILMDSDTTRAPHNFLHFTGDVVNPSLTLNISNFEIIGNNIPYSKQHPFISNITNSYMSAISGLNLKTSNINNVTIRNFYGTGIILANYYESQKEPKLNRMESPKITNCSIVNVWAYNAKDQSGDAIAMWGVNKPVVQNNVMINTIKTTKFAGRAGLVLEHYTENAVVKKNKIGGYNRNIHIECDYGGHLISYNTLSQSSIAITLSEDCGLTASQKNLYSPIIIENNSMIYNQEFRRFNIPKKDYAFISVHRASPMLDGLTIRNNTMTYFLDKTVDQSKTSTRVKEKNKNIYIELNGQQNAVIDRNIFK